MKKINYIWTVLLSFFVVNNLSAQFYEQKVIIKASNAEAEDRFGYGMAYYQGTLAVGAKLEDSNATGANGDEDNNDSQDSGAVYIYEVDGEGTWSQAAYVKAPENLAFDQFGSAIALYEDKLIIASIAEDNYRGAVYFYQKDLGGQWVFKQKLTAPGTRDVADQYGFAVALHQGFLVVSEIGNDSSATGLNSLNSDNLSVDSGAIYQYVYQQGTESFVLETTFKPLGVNTEELQYGHSIDMARIDTLGTTVLAVGAPGMAHTNGGQVWMFYHDSNAPNNWDTFSSGASGFPIARPGIIETGDQFGFSVSLSSTGENLLVGAIGDDSASLGSGGFPSIDDADAEDSGAAYHYSFTVSGAPCGNFCFDEDYYLKADGYPLGFSSDGDQFGYSVASENGKVVIGAHQAGTDDGAAYVVAVGDIDMEYIVREPVFDVSDGHFGSAVLISEDGQTAVVSAPSDSAVYGGGLPVTEPPAADTIFMNGFDSGADLKPSSGSVFVFDLGEI